MRDYEHHNIHQISQGLFTIGFRSSKRIELDFQSTTKTISQKFQKFGSISFHTPIHTRSMPESCHVGPIPHHHHLLIFKCIQCIRYIPHPLYVAAMPLMKSLNRYVHMYFYYICMYLFLYLYLYLKNMIFIFISM